MFARVDGRIHWGIAHIYCIEWLQHFNCLLNCLPKGIETIVVDGGSVDSTVAKAALLADKVISSENVRAVQMNAGAAAASGEILLFLHVDTRLPRYFIRDLQQFLLSKEAWGGFDVRIDNTKIMFRIIELMMNLHSRITGICTVDQVMFIRRSAFEQVSGFPVITLMEDIEISNRLNKFSRPFCVKNLVLISARRWLDGGILKTILVRWRLRIEYFLGG